MEGIFGRRVRLKQKYFSTDNFVARVKRGEDPWLTASERVSEKLVIPEGSEGTITEGSPYNAGNFDYTKEWPVNFDMFSKGYGVRGFAKEFCIGIPHDLLETIDDKKANPVPDISNRREKLRS